jgi:murein DD-endopeptidase
MTCCAHLARSVVEVGQILKAGDQIAISGYSGLDSLITFPFGIPHVHFNTWLNGTPVDPFKLPSGKSLWKDLEPTTITSLTINEDYTYIPSEYDEKKVEQAIESCITESAKLELNSKKNMNLKAADLIAHMNYYPTRFPERFNVYDKEYHGERVLSLPFSSDDFDGFVFIDEL